MTQTRETTAVARPAPAAGAYLPRVDVVETDDELILYADLPGVRPDDVGLEFRDGELTLHARCAPRHAGRRPVYAEYGVADFRRSFRVAEEVDPDRVDAAMMDGVLAVRLPKAESARPKKIAVKAG